MDEATMQQVREETHRQMERQLERDIWQSGMNGTKFNGLTGNSHREPDDSGELMSSLKSLAEKVHGTPPEPAFSWETPDLTEYNARYRYQWRAKMARSAVFDAARLAMLTSLRKHMVDERAMLMRRTADISPDLIATAEIRALENPG